MQGLETLWDTALKEMSKIFSSTSMNLWFEDSCILSLDDSTVVIQIPDNKNNKRDIIEKRFIGNLSECLENLIGYPVRIVLQVKDEPVAENNQYVLDESIEDIRFHPGNEYTFENFIVGSSNKFVYAACTAVASSPATDYNPLFIYSKPGLGKTHLLNAIMNRIYKNNPDCNIIYVKGEEFTNQLIEAISHHSTEAFRRKYRKADVLLIDDIQFIAGKESTQLEFFHTFNVLYEDGKQIILTSDRPPKDMKELEVRLRGRFEWGLLADIQPPDYELRIAIMKNKAKMLGLYIPPEVLAYLADNLRSDIRQIEGTVKKISARCYLSNEPITLELAKECISSIVRTDVSPTVTADAIVAHVGRKYNVAVDDILGRQRNKPIARARNIAIYVIQRVTGMSQTTLGKMFNRDRTTVLNSISVIKDEITENPLFEIEINDLIKEITE